MPSPSETDTTSRCASCGVPRNFGKSCKYCGTVYAETVSTLPPDQDLPELDEKYTVTQEGRGVSISVPLRKTVNVFIAVFIAFFVFCTLVILIGFTGSGNPSLSATSHTIIPFLFKTIIGGGLTVFAFLCWFNRVTIEANSRYLSLRHHPVPLQLGMKIRTEDMVDLRVVAQRKSYKNESWDVPVLRASTVTGTHRDVMVGRLEADFGDFDVIQRHLSKALAS